MESGALIDMLGAWIDAYPIVSIEDLLGEDDTAGMVEFTRRFGDRVQIIGDDYLVTNAAFVQQAAADKACNAALIKVNEAGAVTEAVEAFTSAREAGWTAVVSAPPVRRNRRRFHSPSQHGPWMRTAQSRVVPKIGAHGKVERVLSHSG